jgi:hypothetical protein
MTDVLVDPTGNTRCYAVGCMENNTDKQVSDGEAKAKPEVIKLGLDLHARQVDVMITSYKSVM